MKIGDTFNLGNLKYQLVCIKEDTDFLMSQPMYTEDVVDTDESKKGVLDWVLKDFDVPCRYSVLKSDKANHNFLIIKDDVENAAYGVSWRNKDTREVIDDLIEQETYPDCDSCLVEYLNKNLSTKLTVIIFGVYGEMVNYTVIEDKIINSYDDYIEFINDKDMIAARDDYWTTIFRKNSNEEERL